MEILAGALAILSLALAFQAEPELFLSTICNTALNMLNDDDLRHETGAPDWVDMGEFAADTLADVLRFINVVAQLAVDDQREHRGGIHILSSYAKLEFHVKPNVSPPKEAQCLRSIWEDVPQDVAGIDIYEIVVGEDMKLACGPQQGAVRLSLKYIGPSSATSLDKPGKMPQSQAYIVTRRDPIHHTDEEGRFHIIGVFGTRKAAIKRAKQHVKEELERVGGTSERYDSGEYACAIHPSWVEEFELKIEVEQYSFEDGDAVDDDDDGEDDEDEEDDDRSIVEGFSSSEYDSEGEGYTFEIQRRKPQRLWSDAEDEDEEGADDEAAKEEEELWAYNKAIERSVFGEGPSDLVYLGTQPARKRALPDDEDEIPSRSTRPRFEP
ncbi:hypothetical protein PRZ48_006438 [Zasmidium cellare]|uniref:Uncharacterized protein n=1 Tax=Zasmidium cellare TaxID=395010 RepID=A0ABR0EN37_ZASCE|nr:hypothetical protein PRZ48_006438 [Zasmidium cellare]